MAGFVTARNVLAGNENLNVNDKVYPTTQITVFGENGDEIGWVQDINESQERGVEPVRHLNSDDAGRIVQGVPRPANYTLSVTGFAIYMPNTDTEGTTIARLIEKAANNPSKLMKSLEEQKYPFAIRKSIVNPNGENSETYYHGCWITRFNNPTSINNAFVTETVDLFVSYIDGE